MSSIRVLTRKNGTVAAQVMYRAFDAGKGRTVQTGITFDDYATAQRWQTLLDKVGPEKALEVLKAQRAAARPTETTIEQWCETYISKLTGVGEGTPRRYRRYVANDIASFFDGAPLSEVVRDTIGEWVVYLSGDGDLEHHSNSSKTIKNKHGFLYAAFAAAVRDGKMLTNPCEGTQLPEGLGTEMVFLDPDEWTVLHDCLAPKWRPLATFLLLTGMRFGEATALTVGDINPRTAAARIDKAWKDTGSQSKRVLGPPKTKKGKRTITVAPEAMELLDLDRPRKELLFVSGGGRNVSSGLFYDPWDRARVKAFPVIQKRPRVHDLRHTCVSWMIGGRVPLPVIQEYVGHESIVTTVDRYGHVDQTGNQLAAAAVGAALATGRRPQE